MSFGSTIRVLWAKDPVVAASIAIGIVGLSIPLIVPKYWGKYPDSMKEEERLKRDADALAKANKRYGVF